MKEVALTRLAQPDVAASWGKVIVGTALAHPWHGLGSWLFIESQVMGQLLTSMASKSEPKDRMVTHPGVDKGMFLRAPKLYVDDHKLVLDALQ